MAVNGAADLPSLQLPPRESGLCRDSAGKVVTVALKVLDGHDGHFVRGAFLTLDSRPAVVSSMLSGLRGLVLDLEALSAWVRPCARILKC